MADIYARHVAGAQGDSFRLQAMAIDMPYKQYRKYKIGTPTQREGKDELDAQFEDRNEPEEVSDDVWELELRYPLTVHRRGGQNEIIETVTINHPAVEDLEVRDVDDPDQMRRVIGRLTGLRMGQIDDLRVGDYMAILNLVVQMIRDVRKSA